MAFGLDIFQFFNYVGFETRADFSRFSDYK